MKQLVKNIGFKLKKWFIVYRKAYSGSILWPLTLVSRQAIFKQMANTTTQFLARGWVLDVGTGPGFLPIEIAKNSPNVHVVGVDIALELLNDGIKRAKDKQLDDRISFLRANTESLPFENDTFDMVLSMFSLHLWSNRQLGISEMCRVLKPGGEILILVGRFYLLHGLAIVTDYFTRRSISCIRKMCFNAGFKEVEINGVRELRIMAKK